MPEAGFHARLSRAIAGCCLVLASPAASETLQHAWMQAYRNNPSLEAQRASLRAIDEQVSQALSHWRPSIDATGKHRWQDLSVCAGAGTL